MNPFAKNSWEPPASDFIRDYDTTNLKGLVPESWCCIDCGMNTAPGFTNRVDGEAAIKALGSVWKYDLGGIKEQVGFDAEVYMVRVAVWKKAGMADFGGCLCIGCLERRIGRKLKPKDFLRNHSLNWLPGTPRLLDRRGG
jgi:hypothetical protein